MAEPENFTDVVRRAAEFLTALQIPFALIGGAAFVARVRIRSTVDVDAFLRCEPRDLDRVVRIAREKGYDFTDRDVADFKEAGLIRLWGPPGRDVGLSCDVMLADTEFTRRAVDQATVVDVFGHPLRVVTVEDLLLLKVEADRPQDMEDAIDIKDVLGPKLDLVYLRAQADKLGPGVRRRLDLLLPP